MLFGSLERHAVLCRQCSRRHAGEEEMETDRHRQDVVVWSACRAATRGGSSRLHLKRGVAAGVLNGFQRTRVDTGGVGAFRRSYRCKWIRVAIMGMYVVMIKSSAKCLSPDRCYIPSASIDRGSLMSRRSRSISGHLLADRSIARWLIIIRAVNRSGICK